jgi:hypothetical protein
MKYKIVNKGSAALLDKVAKQEDEMFIRIFYNGKVINYLFNPSDVKNIGLSNIFDMIDPDPDLLEAQANWESLKALPTRKKRLTKNA